MQGPGMLLYVLDLAGVAVVLGLRLGAAWRGLHMPVPGPGDGAER